MANSLSLKIGSLITKKNSQKFQKLSKIDGTKALWDAVRSVTEGRADPPRIPHGMTADSLNRHYESISTDLNYFEPAPKTTVTRLGICVVTEEMIFYLLISLKNSASGLDAIPVWFLRLGAPILVKPISQIFNSSIMNSHCPIQWKNSRIAPVPKISNPVTHSDYRPISVTPVLSRILEKIIVRTFIYPALTDPRPPCSFIDQHAFRPTGSTSTALIHLLHVIISLLAHEPYVRLIVLDFSKAFDSARHSTFAEKLSCLNMPDNIYNWFINFLPRRSHQTCFDKILSEVAEINASFVQGSGIGPSSYDVAASDLRALHQGNLMLKYADDSDLVVPASNSDTVESELNHVEAWASDNNLNLNRGKSFEIIFFSGRARNMPGHTNHPCHSTG